jgi:transcription initiation factor TFIIIB Brf1 subunit/transcription initiation factor TFIIB
MRIQSVTANSWRTIIHIPRVLLRLGLIVSAARDIARRAEGKGLGAARGASNLAERSARLGRACLDGGGRRQLVRARIAAAVRGRSAQVVVIACNRAVAAIRACKSPVPKSECYRISLSSQMQQGESHLFSIAKWYVHRIV